MQAACGKWSPLTDRPAKPHNKISLQTALEFIFLAHFATFIKFKLSSCCFVPGRVKIKCSWREQTDFPSLQPRFEVGGEQNVNSRVNLLKAFRRRLIYFSGLERFAQNDSLLQEFLGIWLAWRVGRPDQVRLIKPKKLSKFLDWLIWSWCVAGKPQKLPLATDDFEATTSIISNSGYVSLLKIAMPLFIRSKSFALKLDRMERR